MLSYDIIIENILFVNAIEQEDDPNNLTLKICLKFEPNISDLKCEDS